MNTTSIKHPMKFKLVDKITFIYFLSVSFLIAFFRYRVDQWSMYLLVHALYLSVIVLMVWLESKAPENRIIKFFRNMYPLFALGLVYKSTEGYVLIFHGQFLDPLINHFEKLWFGEYPSLLLEKIATRPLNEFFFFNYFSYYFYFTLPALLLFFHKRYLDLERFIFNITTAFYFAYIGFVIFPVEGPIFSLKNLFTIPALEGYFFVPLQNFLMAHGDPRGACYPSSHIVVCWVSLFSIRQIFGAKPFWIIFPFALCLSISVVYNRFHYLSDVLAGFVTVWICLSISRWVYKDSFDHAVEAEI